MPDPRELATLIQDLLKRDLSEEALVLCEQRLALDPGDATALTGVGVIHLLRPDYERAETYFRRAVRAAPHDPDRWSNLGTVCLLRQDYRGAVGFLAQARRKGAVALDGYALACRKLAADLYYRGSWSGAVRYLQLALREDAADKDAWSDLGSLYARAGRIRAADRSFRKAIALDPERLLFRSNLAVNCNYRSDLSHEQIRDAHIEIFRSLGPPAGDHANEPAPHRRLRVGYYSSEFRFGPPAFFLPAILKYHDRAQFEIFCYSNTQKLDEYTTKLRCLADHWRDVREMDDGQLTQQVRADGIDVLVDRTGHFEHGRPGLFSRGAAPVQVSLPGYPATTGVPGIGYRITDAYADPPGMTDHLHTEVLFRLPDCFACYTPAERSPEVTQLPALRNGYITFGCFQKRQKITAAMIGLWARILAALPGSRLKFHHLFSGVEEVPRELRRGIEAVFRKRGVGAERISWAGGQPHYEHLESVASVDIALDTFPYNGMTTTCECLWMGVPVATRAGDAHVSRVGMSYLSNVGLFDWVAASDEEYVALAVRHAEDLPELAKTRLNLRSAMRASPLTDAHSYTRNLEGAFRTMWHSWCSRQAVSS